MESRGTTYPRRAARAAVWLFIGAVVGYTGSSLGFEPWSLKDDGSAVWESFIEDGCKGAWSIAFWDRDGKATADGLPDLRSPYLMCSLATIDPVAGHDSRCVDNVWSVTIHPIGANTARLEATDSAGIRSDHFVRLTRQGSGMWIEYFPSEAFDNPMLTKVMTRTHLSRRSVW